MKQHRITILFLDIVFGLVFVLFNFDGFIRYIARRSVNNSMVAELITDISRWPGRVVPLTGEATSTFLHDVLVVCFYGIWIYLGFVVILALFRRDFKIALNGVAGTIGGFFGLSFLAWLGVVLVALAGVIIAIGRFFGVIWSYISDFFVMVFRFFGSILTAIWEFLQPIISFLLPIVLVILAIIFVIWLLVQIYRGYGLKSIVALAVAGVLVYIAWPVLVSIFERFILPVLKWFGTIIGSIFVFISKAIIWLLVHLFPLAYIMLVVGLVLTVIGSVGALVVDQIKSAWHCGSGHRGVLLGSLSIGLAVALIVWASIGTVSTAAAVDQAWHDSALVMEDLQLTHVLETTLPRAVKTATHDLLEGAGAPNFDALLLAIILPIAYVGILRGIRKREDDAFRSSFVHRDVLLVGGALMLAIPAVILMILSVLAPSED